MGGFTDKWTQQRERLRAFTEQGRVFVFWCNGRLHVAAPPTYEFERTAKEMAGRWRPKTRVWSFAANQKPAILRALWAFYGRSQVRMEEK